MCRRFKSAPDHFLTRPSPVVSQYAKSLSGRFSFRQVGAWSPVRATEHYKLTVNPTYAVPNHGRIGQQYFVRRILVLEKWLSMAGGRLAALRNALFDVNHKLTLPRNDWGGISLIWTASCLAT